ncbi:MAG: CRTAC1 family protein [Planctomycetes bacterium]|nr:CRTAC1 family protein [Planctomycetota bacterium]MCB9904912.1 CRTAC1 family protein [Planctomycetota bacterium]
MRQPPLPLALAAFCLLAACAEEAGPADFPDEARARGVDYVNRSGRPEKATILEANGAGVALFDLGGDGDLDIVFAQGLPSLDALTTGPGADLAIYENDGRGNFRRLPGPGLSGWWTGLAAGDVDNDGDTDLVAGGFGALRVLWQEDGKLVPGPDLIGLPPYDEDAALVPGRPRAAGKPPAWITSLALFDSNGDGALDLYVGQYLDLDPVDPPLGELGEGALAVPCRWKGHEVYCGPRGMRAQPDRLLWGAANGVFWDATRDALPGHQPGFTLGVLPFDADGDGDTDLFVANDSAANLMLVNEGNGRFVDHGFETGLAYSPEGMPEAGMGVASGDVDRDGFLDIALTNFSDEPTALYLGVPTGFKNATFRYGLGNETRPLLSWGVHLVDFDGDGWLELFTANGHVYPQADEPLTGTSYAQADTLWHLGPEPRARRFEPLRDDSIFAQPTSSRGSAVGDLDGDARPDLVVTRIDGPAALGMNRTGAKNHRLELVLRGPEGYPDDYRGRRTPRDAMGARVEIIMDAKDELPRLRGEVQTASGYQSASAPWLHFGFGERTGFEQIRVFWPSGATELIFAGPADRRLVIQEGQGIVERRDL